VQGTVPAPNQTEEGPDSDTSDLPMADNGSAGVDKPEPSPEPSPEEQPDTRVLEGLIWFSSEVLAVLTTRNDSGIAPVKQVWMPISSRSNETAKPSHGYLQGHSSIARLQRTPKPNWTNPSALTPW